jgi:beta-glucosidase
MNDKYFLPLAKNNKILVAGPSAQSLSALNGCWSYTWQGKDERWYPSDSKTILQAITDKVGAANVITTSGKGFDNPLNYDAVALTKAAATVDVIILCIGENAYAESPGNIADLALDKNQVDLANAAFLTGKPVLLVLTEGRPRFITNLEPPAKGILMAYWSGKKTAEAIADVLFGDYNPDGVLPFSYPRSMGEIVMYDRKPTEDVREVFNDDIHTGYNPLFAFGHGLSYTKFEIGDIILSSTSIKGNETLNVSVSVKNAGKLEGKHTIELYTRDLFASITPNMKRLRAFKKIFLKAGESQTVRFTINKDDLAFVNSQMITITEPGDFEVMIEDRKAMFSFK